MSISVEDKEMVPVVEFRREMTHLLLQLRRRELPKVVITSHGRLKAVVLSVREYEKLLEAAK